VALVTGTRCGIGQSVAFALARAGARVGIAVRTAEEMSRVAGELRAAGAPVHAVAADVSVPGDVQSLVAEIRLYLGPIDLLVNNAGLAEWEDRPLWEAHREAWGRIIAVNVRGPMLCCHAVLPAMIAAGRGHVFNVNSPAGARGGPIDSAYAVSKAALSRLTESLGNALTGTGVSVFDVSPGLAAWTPPEGTGEMIVRLASGGHEALSGRFIHADPVLGYAPAPD
jgi:3-oxoacyl-[acyl-carrier protein] reductase